MRITPLIYALFALVIIGLGAPAHARQQAREPAATAPMTGMWIVTARTDEGDQAFKLQLEQQDDAVTGTFITPHGEARVAGTFADRVLKLAAPEHDESDLQITAKTNPDGTLTGYLTSAMGEAVVTLSREKSGR